MIKVIIFDLDGLLINSQPLKFQAYKEAFSKYGEELNINDWEQWIHKSYAPREWIKLKKLQIDPEELYLEMKEVYEKLVKDELELKPGANELLNKLYGKYKLCLASSSRIDSIKLAIDKFNLESKFEKIISDTKLGRPKPYPDVFLEIARLIEVESNECVVIEDSIAGLKAAKAANMKCIVCPDSFIPINISKYAGADKLVNTLNEVTLEMIQD